MREFILNYGGIIAAFLAGAAGVFAPLLVPKFSEFLLGRSLERYRLTLLKIQKAEKIAQLFAYMPRIYAGSDLTTQDEIRINELILELSLYLPRDLVCELSEHISNPEKRPYYKRCFVKIRAYLIGSDDGLNEDNISHFIIIK